jgi:hypothetical protein
VPSDPDTLVDLTSISGEIEGQKLVSALASEGITASIAGTNILIFGLHGTFPGRLMVRRADLEPARAVLLRCRGSHTKARFTRALLIPILILGILTLWMIFIAVNGGI